MLYVFCVCVREWGNGGMGVHYLWMFCRGWERGDIERMYWGLRNCDPYYCIKGKNSYFSQLVAPPGGTVQNTGWRGAAHTANRCQYLTSTRSTPHAFHPRPLYPQSTPHSILPPTCRRSHPLLFHSQQLVYKHLILFNKRRWHVSVNTTPTTVKFPRLPA